MAFLTSLFDISHVPPGGERSALSLILLTTLGTFAVLVFSLIGAVIFHAGAHDGMVQQSMLIGNTAVVSELRAREMNELNSYKLLDSDRRIYRIPIDQAMELVVKEAAQ